MSVCRFGGMWGFICAGNDDNVHSHWGGCTYK